MRKSLLLLVLLAASALAFSAGAAEVRKFGQPVGDAKLTPIAEISKNPTAFDRKEVTIEGEVSGVCTMAGCWMEIEDGEACLRVKVKDGEIVFPQDALGKRAKARGWVALTEMSREDYIGWKKHEAEELGQTFDEKSIGEPPYKVVQITGTGAEIDG